MNPDTLATLGPALLANVAADLAAAGLAVPSRRVFPHGEPVRDCDQLAVWVQRIDVGSGGDTSPRAPQGATHRPVTHTVVWGVDLTVCAAETMAEPSAATVTADGVTGARYWWALTRVLTKRWVDATMFAPHEQQLPGGKGVTVSGSTGGVDGAMLTVTATFACSTRDLP